MKKLLFISNTPNDYQHDFYKKLSNYFEIQWFMYEKFINVNNYRWKKKDKNNKIKIIYLKTVNIIDQLNKYDPDLIIIGYVKFFDYLKIITNSFFCKRKIYFHKELPNENVFFLKNILRKLLYKFLFLKICGIFCIGSKAKNFYSKFHKSSFYVPYSISPYKSSPKKIKKINFIFIGQLIDRKSILEIIEAFKLLIKKFPNCNLNIVGKGYYKDACKKNSKNINQINFYGFKNQSFIRKKLSESHILLQPSKYDGWSVAAMQGMNAGLAIVGTKETNCISDNIKHKVNGYICKSNSFSILKGMTFYCKNKTKLKIHMKRNKIIFDNSLMNSNNLSKEVFNIISQN